MVSPTVPVLTGQNGSSRMESSIRSESQPWGWREELVVPRHAAGPLTALQVSLSPFAKGKDEAQRLPGICQLLPLSQ